MQLTKAEATLARGFAQPLPIVEARQLAEAYYVAHGRAGRQALLTPPTGQAKAAKSTKAGFATAMLHLAPARLSSLSVCPPSTPECRSFCLNTAGRGRFAEVQDGRILRTDFFAQYPEAAAALLMHEVRIAGAKDWAVRLNATSDIRWEFVAPDLFGVALLYDYTKWPLGKRDRSLGYHLTFSASERTSEDEIRKTVDSGTNVAVVFGDVPDTYLGYQVIDGDQDDTRFRDPEGVIVGLKAKGSARKAEVGGFIR